MKLLRVGFLALFAFPLSATDSLFQEFESNGVKGSFISPSEKTVVFVKASNCNVEAITVRLILSKGETTVNHFVTKTLTVTRCQPEPVMFSFDREAFEQVVIITVQELVVNSTVTLSPKI